jgi:hypothetical protein
LSGFVEDNAFFEALPAGAKGRLLRAVQHEKFQKEHKDGKHAVIVNVDQDPSAITLMGRCVPCPLRGSTLWCCGRENDRYTERYLFPKEQLLTMGVSLYNLPFDTGIPSPIMTDNFRKEELLTFAGNGVCAP